MKNISYSPRGLETYLDLKEALEILAHTHYDNVSIKRGISYPNGAMRAEILKRFYLNGETHVEIAKSLETTHQNVALIKKKAIDNLRDILTKIRVR